MRRPPAAAPPVRARVLDFMAVHVCRAFGVQLPFGRHDWLVLYNARNEEVARLSGDAVLRMIQRELEGAALSAAIREELAHPRPEGPAAAPRPPLSKAFLTPERRAELRAARARRATPKEGSPMRRLLSALMLLATTTCSPAEAVTITHGVLSAGVTSDFRPAFDIHGNGYDLTRFDYAGEPLHFWVTTRPLGSLVDLSGTSVVKNWATAPSDFTGSLTFSIEPVVWRTGSTTPFTLTGVLNDTPIDGAGTLWIGLYRDDAPSLQQTTFTFEPPLAPTPEPGTLLLMGSGLVGAGVWWRRRRGRSLAVLLPLLLVGGCSPYTPVAEIAGKPPALRATIPGDYDRVALCVLDGMEQRDADLAGGGLMNRYVDRRHEARATITSWAPGAVGTRFVVLEVSTRQDGAAVDVGLRGKSWATERVAPIVERCRRG